LKSFWILGELNKALRLLANQVPHNHGVCLASWLDADSSWSSARLLRFYFFSCAVEEGYLALPCLVPPKIQKNFKISRHIESYGTCIEH